MSLWDDDDADADADRAPICPYCGVTALASESPSAAGAFVCENPDCEAFGDEVEA